MEKTMIIIGAGISGLAAGIYAQKNGYRTRIFEMHFLPGGLCTSWRRKGYLFDGSIRYLNGVAPTSSTYQLWQELGVLENCPIHFYDEFSRFVGEDGRQFRLLTNIDALEEHMLQLSPTDAAITGEFTAALRAFTRLDMPVDLTPTEPQEALELGRRVSPVLLPLMEWQNVSIRQFTERFSDDLLRDGLNQFFQFIPPDFPMLVMFMTLAQMHNREAGYPLGGSLAFAESLANRYQALGGQIHYKSRVTRIIVHNDRAIGVRLADGSEHFADEVISASDGHATIFYLLQRRYVDDTILKYYSQLPVARPILQISLGVRRDFSAEPGMINFPLPRPLLLGEVPHDRLVLKHYNFDPSTAPAGKSALTLWLEADYYYWRRLYFEPERYAAAQEEIASQVIAALDARYPGLAGDVEVVDVATPITYERYTATWHGSFNGWALGSQKMRMMMGTGMRKTLPGLDHFHMIGQWVEPGGNVELSAASGRDVIKDLCKEEGCPFIP